MYNVYKDFHETFEAYALIDRDKYPEEARRILSSGKERCFKSLFDHLDKREPGPYPEKILIKSYNAELGQDNEELPQLPTPQELIIPRRIAEPQLRDVLGNGNYELDLPTDYFIGAVDCVIQEAKDKEGKVSGMIVLGYAANYGKIGTYINMASSGPATCVGFIPETREEELSYVIRKHERLGDDIPIVFYRLKLCE